MVYELGAKHARSQEGQTSVDTDVEPQPGIVHSYRQQNGKRLSRESR